MSGNLKAERFLATRADDFLQEQSGKKKQPAPLEMTVGGVKVGEPKKQARLRRRRGGRGR